MAKHPKQSKPTVKPPDGYETPTVTLKVDTRTEPPPETMPVSKSSVSIPVALMSHGYEPRRCDVSQLTGEQRGKLRRITNGLIAEKAVLKNGRCVTNPQDAVKWILEQV